MKRLRVRRVLVCTIALLIVAPVAQAVVTPERVVGGASDQWAPSANDTWVTFTSYDRHHSAQAMRRSTGFTFRMNERGTYGAMGGLDPDENVAVYQQFTGRVSALYLFDLDSRTRRKAPGVNSPSWEWDPRISNSYITFFRNRTKGGVAYIDLYAFRRETSALRKIVSFKRSAYTFENYPYLWNGSVGDRYITWGAWRNGSEDGDVFVYDTVERTTKRVTGGGDKVEYAGVVDEANGFVYFVRSGDRCGVNVSVWRVPLAALGSTPTKVVSLPDGYDAGWAASIAVNGDTGGTDYYFERGKCGRWNADVYVAEAVDTV